MQASVLSTTRSPEAVVSDGQPAWGRMLVSVPMPRLDLPREPSLKCPLLFGGHLMSVSKRPGRIGSVETGRGSRARVLRYG